MPHAPSDDWRRHGESVGALLASRAALGGDAVFLHLLDDHGSETPVSYAALHAGACRMASALAARGVGPGSRVMLGLPTGLPFLELFFGALMLGAVAVPFYPPVRTKGLDDYQAHLASLMRAARPTLTVTFARARLPVEAAAFASGAAGPVVTPEMLTAMEGFTPAPVAGDDLALIQFTSGSTSAPKGVMLTHRHLLANVAATVQVIKPVPGDVACSWLPLYHDMGLIGLLLIPLFAGTPLVLMSPQAFLLDPKRWLWAIHRHRVSISTAPNFAYQMVASRLQDRELEGLDLSCWRLAYNGAEPVLLSTIEAFAARLAPYGFAAQALNPIYGMAEVAVAAAFPEPGRGPWADWIDAEKLESEGEAAPVAPETHEGRSTSFMAVGKPLPGYEARIVAEDGTVLAERRVGEIQLRGPSVLSGYLDDPEATASTLVDGWLRTGDLGYMAEGELFIVGRLKDMILRGGRNYAPQDLERLATEVDEVRKGCVAAFGVPDPATGTEAVVVLAETKAHAERYSALASAIAGRIHQGLGLTPDRVEMVPPGHLPKTSSGKIQRGKARDRYIARALEAAREPGLLSQTRLVARAFAHRLGTAGGRPRA